MDNWHRTLKARLCRARPAAIAASVVLLAHLGCSTGDDGANTAGYRGELLSEPRAKVDFTLTDTEGEPFHFLDETEGYVTLLFFGYTYCPDVCPVHMANIAAVLKDFPFDLSQQFKVVFITTDPERDTPERLREWLDNFDSSFIGLRGTQDEVNEVSVALGSPPAVRVEVEDGGYLVGHSANVLAFTRDNVAHIRYPFGTRQADYAHDLPKLASETWDDR